MNYHRLLIGITMVMIIFAACRKQWSATDEDMANYGWTLYEQGEYLDSYEWFSNSIREDLDYQDGYNGLGWTYGCLLYTSDAADEL